MPQHALYTQYTAKRGQGEALIEVLKKTYDIVAEAEGCRIYIINQEAADADTIWVTELWDKQEDHAISQTLDGCKELEIEASHLLSRDPKQIVLRVIGGRNAGE